MHVVAVTMLVVWVLFWMAWLVASVGVTRGRTNWRRFSGIRVAILVVMLLLVRIGVFRGQTITSNPWREATGLALFAAGLAVAVWARVCIGRNWGAPMTEKADPVLVVTGPYRRIRHPIYSGIILAMMGTAVAVNWYWVIAVALLGPYFVYSAVIEERFLAQRLPEAYPRYRRTTRMLIPFIY